MVNPSIMSKSSNSTDDNFWQSEDALKQLRNKVIQVQTFCIYKIYIFNQINIIMHNRKEYMPVEVSHVIPRMGVSLGMELGKEEGQCFNAYDLIYLQFCLHVLSTLTL